MAEKNLKASFLKACRGVGQFFVDLRESRMNHNTRDYRAESRKKDKLSDQELVASIDRERVVCVSDVRQILKRLQARTDFNCSDEDAQAYIAPVFKVLDRHIRRNEFEDYIECHIALHEDLEQDARVKVGDFLDFIAMKFDLPDGRPDSPPLREDVFVADDIAFDDNTRLGRLRNKMNKAMPLRTASTDGHYETQETGQSLNVKRPLLLAIDLAGKYCDQRREIEAGNIPTFRETVLERQTAAQKPKAPRYYRGQRID